jgi:hypothetical protein
MVLDPNQKKDRIETLKDVLYSKDENNLLNRRRHVLKSRKDFYDTPTSWKEEDKKELRIPYEKILLGTFIFFILSLGFTFFKFFGGSNIISGNNIDILVSGPVSVSGGEEFSLNVEVKNNNNVDLQVVDLQVEFPDGTRNTDDLSRELKRYSEILGSIDVGNSEERIIKAVLFGEENSQKEISINVEYRIPGSNAVFNKQKIYSLLVNSSPVNIKIVGVDEVNSNQQEDFEVEIVSNSLTKINDLVLKIDYPFGFNIISSNPISNEKNNNIFVLGDLEPGGKRTIKISTIIQGQGGENRIIKFIVGTPQEGDNAIIKVPFSITSKEVAIKESFISLDFGLNGLLGDKISIRNGNNVESIIAWKNNLNEKIYNMSVKLKISGLALDKSSVEVEGGFYDSYTNTIIFDKQYNENFSIIKPADSGILKFNFNILPQVSKPQVSFSNSVIKIETVVTGSLIDEEATRSEVLFSNSKDIRVTSDINLLSRAFRTVGPFENTGPIPPKVDNKTTYTITWTVTNSFNNLKDVKVTSFLSPNIGWIGNMDPENKKVVFNSDTGEIIWDIGDMKMDTGDKNPAETVSFQVFIIPSASQIGKEVNLLEETIVSGVDVFSDEKIVNSKPLINTNIISDPSYFKDIGRVVN